MNLFASDAEPANFHVLRKPYKAIYVEGNGKHLQAQKPVSKDIKQKVNLKEDFPF